MKKKYGRCWSYWKCFEEELRDYTSDSKTNFKVVDFLILQNQQVMAVPGREKLSKLEGYFFLCCSPYVILKDAYHGRVPHGRRHLDQVCTLPKNTDAVLGDCRVSRWTRRSDCVVQKPRSTRWSSLHAAVHSTGTTGNFHLWWIKRRTILNGGKMDEHDLLVQNEWKSWADGSLDSEYKVEPNFEYENPLVRGNEEQSQRRY